MSSGEVYSQFLNQKDLEKKRIELTNEIKNIQNLITSSKNEKKLVIENIENLNYKLDLQNEVIKIINNELNIISNSIHNNQLKNSQLLEAQELLKSQYGEMILRSYKTRSKTGKLMFVFSSANFQQALKRIQYFKQYSEYQIMILQKIKKNTAELKTLNNQLREERNRQQVLINNNQKLKTNINTQIVDKNSLLQSISSNQRKYIREITSNQKKTAEIDKQIQRIIALAIAESNKKKNNQFKIVVKI